MRRRIKLTERELRNMISESVRRFLDESFDKPSNWKETEFRGTFEDEDGALYMPDDYYDEDMNSYVDEDGETIYYDSEGWEYMKDEYGYLIPTGYMYDPETGESYQADYEGNRMDEKKLRKRSNKSYKKRF